MDTVDTYTPLMVVLPRDGDEYQHHSTRRTVDQGRVHRRGSGAAKFSGRNQALRKREASAPPLELA